MSAFTERVFVYGTLRRGGSHHFRMAGAGFAAAGFVRGRLYRIDWYPGLVLETAGGLVTGDVFDVTPELLSQLDEFEGADYRRTRTCVGTGQGDMENVWVWEWRGGVEGYPQIGHGDWLCDSATG